MAWRGATDEEAAQLWIVSFAQGNGVKTGFVRLAASGGYNPATTEKMVTIKDGDGFPEEVVLDPDKYVFWDGKKFKRAKVEPGGNLLIEA